MNSTSPLRSRSQTASTRSAPGYPRSAMSSSSRHRPSSSLTTPSDVRCKKVTPQRGCLRLQSKSRRSEFAETRPVCLAEPILPNACTTPPSKTSSKARVRFSSIPDRGRKKKSVDENAAMDWQGEEAEWTDFDNADSGSDTEISSDDDVDTLFPLVFGRDRSELSRRVFGYASRPSVLLITVPLARQGTNRSQLQERLQAGHIKTRARCDRYSSSSVLR